MISKPNRSHSHFLVSFGTPMNILFNIIVKILMLIMWSNKSLLIMLTTETGMASILRIHSQIFFQTRVFLMSTPRSTPNHIVVQIFVVLELGTSTPPCPHNVHTCEKPCSSISTPIHSLEKLPLV